MLKTAVNFYLSQLTISNKCYLFLYAVVLDCTMNSPECIECNGEGPTDCFRCDYGYFLYGGTCMGMPQMYKYDYSKILK